MILLRGIGVGGPLVTVGLGQGSAIEDRRSMGFFGVSYQKRRKEELEVIAPTVREAIETLLAEPAAPALAPIPAAIPSQMEYILTALLMHELSGSVKIKFQTGKLSKAEMDAILAAILVGEIVQ